MKTLDEKIAVMTAYKNGARIERRPHGTERWLWSDDPSWDWECVDYRVAETPKVVVPREYGILLNTAGTIVDAFVWQTERAIGGRSGDELVHVREVLPTKPNAVDLMVEVLPNRTQRIVMPMYLKDIGDLGRTHSFVRVSS